MKKYLVYFLTLIILSLSACGTRTAEQPEVLLNPPAMSVDVTRENCPSMEAEVGMWIAWKNVDTVSLPIIVDQLDANGNVIGTTVP